jgi:hypothetical protein
MEKKMPDTHDMTTAPAADGSVLPNPRFILDQVTADPKQGSTDQYFQQELQRKEARLKGVFLLALAILSLAMVLLDQLAHFVEQVIRLCRELLG